MNFLANSVKYKPDITTSLIETLQWFPMTPGMKSELLPMTKKVFIVHHCLRGSILPLWISVLRQQWLLPIPPTGHSVTPQDACHSCSCSPHISYLRLSEAAPSSFSLNSNASHQRSLSHQLSSRSRPRSLSHQCLPS